MEKARAVGVVQFLDEFVLGGFVLYPLTDLETYPIFFYLHPSPSNNFCLDNLHQEV